MDSLFNSRASHSLFLLAAVVAGLALLAYFVVSDFDLTPFVTLRTETEDGRTVIETRYNPLGLLAFGALAAATCGGGVLLARFAQSLLHRGQAVSADRIAAAGKTLERELANVLAIMRRDLSNKDAYVRSLAEAQTRLSGLTQADQVRVVVRLLIAENERMRRTSAEDKSRIEACTREIDVLRTSLRGAEEETLKDPLTGIGNRRLFDVTMRKAVEDSNARRVPLSLIMCDIDHFKRINDKFGHHVGDEVIRALAGIIEVSVRATDSVARYGGEEFAIILPATTQKTAKEMAERIRIKLGAKSFSIRKTQQKIGQVTASFGIAEHRPGDDMQTLVQRADAKLYEAKARGRDRIADFGDRL